jgi:polysaccharide deacetylase 2 family uncharacterized protein YibQ
MAGQIIGGLLVVGVGVALGVVFGYQPVPDAPLVVPAPIQAPVPVPVPVPIPARSPVPASAEAPSPSPTEISAEAPSSAPPETPAPSEIPISSEAPTPVESAGGEEPGSGSEGGLTSAEVPSLDLAALPPALAVVPGTTVAHPLDGAVELVALPPPQASPAAPSPQVAPPSSASPAADTPGDRPLWLRNAVPFALPAAQPMVALVFDDLGMDRRRTERVIGFPGPLTLSFLPYAGDLPRQTRAAHAAGHELMVHMPMEPLASGLDPGPGVLLTGLSTEENLRRLDHGLAAFEGYVGLNNHMGSRFTSDRAALAPVLAEVNRRGLLFLDSVTIPTSVGAVLASAIGMPHTQRNVFLDNEMTPAAVHAALMRLEALARQTGTAVAIGHPHDVTLDAVAAWLPGLAAKGLVLAPISAVVRARGTTGVRTPSAATEPAVHTTKKGETHG